ncbi:hypothetical protein ACJQWK_00876 [Exserohilum turcicum]|uniref:F-box domain-containing protein n=1 Tax=Exserohilum turcicum (strain 28A) TaxID=671987 RepID=R0IFR5_EXST2|nr:uncharacterized protein SETTUDRAFT_32911 [Exserohilum turcica Et28A]EOA83896.1 hypothetical protein SETTUDRAFT_32911 [Exserohilum turcica Et28A]
MLPFFNIVPGSPSTGPIGWHLHATECGETRTSFASYVQLDFVAGTTTKSAKTGFPDFSRLPAELQVHVLSFCSSATLFRLMHTCSALRHAASKLFWARPDTWYSLDGTWLLAGGFPGETHCVTEFLRRVRQLEIRFEHVREVMPPATDEQDEQIYGFWRALQRLAPRLERVVVSHDAPRITRTISLELLKRVLQKRPRGIDAFASVITAGDASTHRGIRYRGRFGAAGWELTDPEWVRQSVLLPPKAWRGPMGEYAQAQYQIDRCLRMRRARHALRIQAAERSYLSEEEWFKCPGRECHDYFFEGRAWAVHAVETQDFMYADVPVEYKDEFDRYEDMIERVDRRAWDTVLRIRKRYRGASIQERKEIEQETLDQLLCDPDYASSKPAKESGIWMLYQDCVKEER